MLCTVCNDIFEVIRKFLSDSNLVENSLVDLTYKEDAFACAEKLELVLLGNEFNHYEQTFLS